jgi:hypothetical protein
VHRRALVWLLTTLVLAGLLLLLALCREGVS